MNNLIDQLKVHEGSRTHAYDCPAGYITIGVGRNIDPNGGLGLSEDEINYLLRNDIERCYRELDRFSWFMDSRSSQTRGTCEYVLQPWIHQAYQIYEYDGGYGRG
jgi:hypothetical protein